MSAKVPDRVSCLSVHADYKCRHSGACCQAGWTIPFDAAEQAGIDRLSLHGRLKAAGDGSVAERDSAGACSFFERDTHLCEIHRVAGAGALPVTCRMFPRIVRHDPRGTRVSLSHFCPTAAARLFDPSLTVSLAIVETPGALRGRRPLDGLDARDAWPPLLRPGVLMDPESYDAWEDAGVAGLAFAPGRARDALAALREQTAQVTAWQPGTSPSLLDTIGSAMRSESAATNLPEAPIRCWLAARLFGNWIAYQGTGLRTIVAYLEACLAVYEIELARDGQPLEAVRRADLLLLHQADSLDLARLLDKGA